MAKPSKEMAPKVTRENYLDGLNKKMGAGAGFILSDKTAEAVEVIPSGIPVLDRALGVGGLPKGRIIEVYGMESSGKTTLAIQFAAQCQKAGGVVHFIDAEHALDVQYASVLGMDESRTIISQPESGEECLEIASYAVESGCVDLVIVDSVAALVPRSELEGEMGASSMGVQARLMSQAMRKITGACARSNTVVLFINQLRMKIGVMYGNPEVTSGGNALKFYASVRLDVRRVGGIKDGDTEIGNKVKIKVVKNKVAPPFRNCEVDLFFGTGFDSTGSLLDLAVEQGIVDKAGAWYSYQGDRIGQGRENTRKYLIEHPEIEARIKTAVYGTPVPVMVDSEDSSIQ